MMLTYARMLAVGGMAAASLDNWTSPERVVTLAVVLVAVWALFTRGRKDEARKTLADAIEENKVGQITIARLREEATARETEIGHLKTDLAKVGGEKSVLEKIANGEAFLSAMQAAFKEQSEGVARIHAESSQAIVAELRSQTNAIGAQAVAIEHLAKSLKPTRVRKARI